MQGKFLVAVALVQLSLSVCASAFAGEPGFPHSSDLFSLNEKCQYFFNDSKEPTRLSDVEVWESCSFPGEGLYSLVGFDYSGAKIARVDYEESLQRVSIAVSLDGESAEVFAETGFGELSVGATYRANGAPASTLGKAEHAHVLLSSSECVVPELPELKGSPEFGTDFHIGESEAYNDLSQFYEDRVTQKAAGLLRSVLYFASESDLFENVTLPIGLNGITTVIRLIPH